MAPATGKPRHAQVTHGTAHGLLDAGLPQRASTVGTMATDVARVCNVARAGARSSLDLFGLALFDRLKHRVLL